MRRVRAMAVVAMVVIAACGTGEPARTSAPTLASPTTATTSPPTIIYPATKLSIAGYSGGVNQAPFYPPVVVTAVTCPTAPTRSVIATLPAGGSGTALSVPTTLVIEAGKAEVRDHAGRALYREAKPSLAPSDHGSLVLSMTAAASSDSDRRRVPYGALDISGPYLCP